MKNRFISLSVRLITTLALCTIIPIMIFFVVMQNYERIKTTERYVAQSKMSMEVSISNIEYYINSSIAATKNIYSNNTVFSMLATGNPQDFLSADQPKPQQIFSYLKSIRSATPDTMQIRLLSFTLNKSFLLVTDTMQRSLLFVNPKDARLKLFNNFTDIIIEPTHPITTYGHTLSYYNNYNKPRAQVFTIWLPIYRYSYDENPLGVLNIDIPISLIQTNCQLDYNTGESIYVVDESSTIIAGSHIQDAGKRLDNMELLSFMNESGQDFKYSQKGEALYLQESFPASYLPWKLVKVAPISAVNSVFLNQLKYLLTLFSIGVFIATLLNSVAVIRITSPLRKASEYMQAVKKGQGKKNIRKLQLSDYVIYKRNDELNLLFHSLEDMIDSIEQYTIRQYQMKLLNKNMELNMLQAQINPHFVYNTLQCLATKSLVNNDVEQYDFISSFGQMMQYAIDMSRDLVPVSDELDYVNRYFSLQKMRFKSEGKLEIINNSAKWARLPKMTLQPLVENSIYHGNILSKPNGKVTITLETLSNVMHINIIDNGKSISEEECQNQKQKYEYLRRWLVDRYGENDSDAYYLNKTLTNINSTLGKERPHIGLENVYMRLVLRFGPECYMELLPNEQGGTTVCLVIPCP